MPAAVDRCELPDIPIDLHSGASCIHVQVCTGDNIIGAGNFEAAAQVRGAVRQAVAELRLHPGSPATLSTKHIQARTITTESPGSTACEGYSLASEVVSVYSEHGQL